MRVCSISFVTPLRAFIAVSLVISSAQAIGQAQGDVPAGINSPSYSMTDPNNVNLTSTKPTVRLFNVSIGEKKLALSHTTFSVYDQPTNPAIGFSDNFAGRVQLGLTGGVPTSCSTAGGSPLDVIIAGQGDTMCSSVAGSWTSMRLGGTTMIRNADGTLTYTGRDGTKYLFGIMSGANFGWLTQITNPDGRILTLTYKTGVVGSATFRRVQSVNRNDGLQIKYTYESNTLPGSGYPTSWLRLASVTAINNTVDYCDPQADSCSYSLAWPTATHTWATSGSLKYFTATDAGGQSTRLTIGIPTLTPGVAPGVDVGAHFIGFTGDQLLAIRAPTSTSGDTTTYLFCAVMGEYYCMKGAVKKVISDGVEWLYPGTSGSGGPSLFIQITANRPAAIGGSWVTTTQSGNYNAGSLVAHVDNIGKKTYAFEYGLSNRLATVQSVDGDMMTYAYDARSNITQETHTPSSGSALQPLIRTANYDATCANPVTCNKPNWVRDARTKQIDYVYDPVHGGTLKVTSPADANGIRPQARYAYTQRYAWYKNSSGSVVQAATPIWLLSSKKICLKSAALADGSGCSVAGDEVITTYEYGPASGASNLFLRGMAVTADGVTLRACYSVDVYGNRISETLPKAGLSSCP